MPSKGLNYPPNTVFAVVGVLRLGLEYDFKLGIRWIVVPSAFFEWKKTNETYSFSLGVSYKFYLFKRI
jgi:hypothetical protein